VALVHERTVSTDRPPFVGEVSDNLCGKKVCRVVSAADRYCRYLSFLDLSRYYFFQVAPQLDSRVDPVPDPQLFRKSGSAENRTRISGSVARKSGH
jgi:hypothetical protein